MGDQAFNPMSAMSPSLWHKTGRGATSQSPTLMPIQSASMEGSSLHKDPSYSSLQGHADDTSHSSHSRNRYTFKNELDYSEGMMGWATCFYVEIKLPFFHHYLFALQSIKINISWNLWLFSSGTCRQLSADTHKILLMYGGHQIDSIILVSHHIIFSQNSVMI